MNTINDTNINADDTPATTESFGRLKYFFAGVLVPMTFNVAATVRLAERFPDEYLVTVLFILALVFYTSFRRAKDIGMSGWWGVALAFVPLGWMYLLFKKGARA